MYCSTCKYLLEIKQNKLTLRQQLFKTVAALKHCDETIHVTKKFGNVPEWAWYQYNFDLHSEITIIVEKIKCGQSRN